MGGLSDGSRDLSEDTVIAKNPTRAKEGEVPCLLSPSSRHVMALPLGQFS